MSIQLQARWLTLSLFLLISAGLSAEAGERWGVAVFPDGQEFSLEFAEDEASRRLGYMFREHVAPNEGMLFVFDKAERHAFYMKNCRADLDIVWLDAQWKVVEIARDLSPCPPAGPCPNVVPMTPARYVLEVAGGMTSRHGLQAGDRLVVVAEPELP